MTANPGKVITVHDLPSLTNAPYQASFTAKNTAAAFGAAVISGTSKDSLSQEDVRPFPKCGPRCDRRQRRKVKSCISTDLPIMDPIEQELLARAAVKKKYCKGAKKYRNKM